MKNAPVIDFNNVNDEQKPEARSITPTVAALSNRVKTMTPGNTITLSVLGRDVTFICKKIDAQFIEKATMIYSYNIRSQELLDDDSLDDITQTMSKTGQQFPAFGREINGVIEIADGSRRRKAAIITKKDYIVLVGELTNEEMSYLSNTGNDYRKPSSYELGLHYKRRLEREFFNNISQLSEDIKVDRKIIKRCVETASLPIEVIRCFKTPNELSARSGEALAKLYRNNEEAMTNIATEIIKQKKQLTTDEIITKLKAVNIIQNKPIKKIFKPGITAQYKDNSVTFSLKNVSSELIQRIEKIIEES